MFEIRDLSGQEVGIWKILEFDHVEYYGTNGKHGMSYYRCECKKCGTIQLVARSHLTRPCKYHYVDGVMCKGDKQCT